MNRILDYLFYSLYKAYETKNDLPMSNSILYFSLFITFLFFPFIGFVAEIMRDDDCVFFKLFLIAYMALVYIAVRIKYNNNRKIRKLKEKFSYNKKISLWAWLIILLSTLLIAPIAHVLIVKHIILQYGLRGIGYNFLVDLFGK